MDPLFQSSYNSEIIFVIYKVGTTRKYTLIVEHSRYENRYFIELPECGINVSIIFMLSVIPDVFSPHFHRLNSAHKKLQHP